jgi:hypothetical protein
MPKVQLGLTAIPSRAVASLTFPYFGIKVEINRMYFYHFSDLQTAWESMLYSMVLGAKEYIYYQAVDQEL